jgi:hypothetical protein
MHTRHIKVRYYVDGGALTKRSFPHVGIEYRRPRCFVPAASETSSCAMGDRQNAASIQGSLTITVRLVPVWLLEGKLAIRFSPATSRITSHFQLTVDLLMLYDGVRAQEYSPYHSHRHDDLVDLQLYNNNHYIRHFWRLAQRDSCYVSYAMEKHSTEDQTNFVVIQSYDRWHMFCE